MKKGIVLACCAMLLAGQLQSAEALDWNRRIGVDRMIDRTIDNTINRAVNKVEKQEKTRRVIFQNLPQSAAEIGPETVPRRPFPRQTVSDALLLYGRNSGE